MTPEERVTQPTEQARPGGPLLFGVRHHGPGSARAVRSALESAAPKVVLVEGPPEAEKVLELAADPAMVPPVALLAHAIEEPGRAAFWPLASFSPEWVAVRWALEHSVPVWFIDLPAAHTLAMRPDPQSEQVEPPPEPPPEPLSEPPSDTPPETSTGWPDGVRTDPLAVLAEAAGYDDPERWWEDVVEHRGALTHQAAQPDGHQEPDGLGERALAPAQTFQAFLALEEAMGALRETPDSRSESERDLVREAHMRLRLREARREFGDDGVAVVCGAWHVPALREKRTVSSDRQLLRGLPKVKTEITWVPWTYRRLARRSGYGAGITSPGWYDHLFSAPDRPLERWMTKIAAMLRAEDYPVSSAHVIEAVRLAESLATLRGRPLAGLEETIEAVRAVMAEGSDIPLNLVRDRLIVTDLLGEVPDAAPAVPLRRDLTKLQRSLRLKPEVAERQLDLDLRKDTDASRSRLLHQLRLLGIHWGELARGRTGSTGTFRESWRLSWEPELSVRTAEAGVWGTTVAAAAEAKAVAAAGEQAELAEVTKLAEDCLLAGLRGALPVVMRTLADRAALDADVGHLAQALPALARSVRYGDVRGTDDSALREVADGLAERVCVGLPPACVGLDADGAAEMRGHLDVAHQALGLLDSPDLAERWAGMLRTLATRESTPGTLRGRSARLLLDEGRLPTEEAERLMGLELSVGAPPLEAAAWVEGFLAGGGMLLVHDERLLALVDDWLTQVPSTAFEDVLPLLRRTFSVYEPGVRRNLGELVRRGTGVRGAPEGGSAAPAGFGPQLDARRAAAVLPTLRLLLGTGATPDDESHGVTQAQETVRAGS